jgi:hypothetical protein
MGGGGEFGCIHRLAAGTAGMQACQRTRARQAAGMGGQDPVGAAQRCFLRQGSDV